MSKRTRDDDDDAFDERGVIKDGKSIRVSMMMRDSVTDLQRAVMQDKLERYRPSPH